MNTSDLTASQMNARQSVKRPLTVKAHKEFSPDGKSNEREAKRPKTTDCKAHKELNPDGKSNERNAKCPMTADHKVQFTSEQKANVLQALQAATFAVVSKKCQEEA